MAKKQTKTETVSEQQVSEIETKEPKSNGSHTNLQPVNTPVATRRDTEVYGSDIEGVDMEAFDAIHAASMDNVTTGELQVSRLAIAQPGTPEVAGGEDGWSGGMLFDNISREILSIYGRPPWLIAKGIADARPVNYLPFVPVFRLPTEYVKWPNKEEREQGIKNFHWKELDHNIPKVREGLWAPKGTWKDKGSPPVTEHLNILGMCLGQDAQPKSNFIVGSFSRTSFKIGQKLVTQCVQQKISGLPFWGRVYYLFTEVKKKNNNTYYVLNFAKGERLLDYAIANGLGTEEENQALGKKHFKTCYDMALQLSNPDGGKEYQVMLINAAAFSEDNEDSEAGGHDGDEGSTEEPNF